MDKKNCYNCESRIGTVCMKNAVLLRYKNGLPVNEHDREYLEKLCWCETGIGGTQYELKRRPL
jgi:hypothetical protein